MLLSGGVEENSQTSTAIAPRKIKASNVTYSKLIALNNNPSGVPLPDETVSPTAVVSISVSPTESAIPTMATPPVITEPMAITATPVLLASSASGSATTITPTPTEIILAYNNASASPKVTSVVSSASPTSVSNLPATGFINNAIIMFTMASLLIFFAFLF